MHLNHVNRNFPDFAARIDWLASRDSMVAELVKDYEQLCDWHASQSPSSTTRIDELEGAGELIRELENEIRQYLEEYDEHTH